MFKKILLICFCFISTLLFNTNKAEAHIYSVSPIGSPLITEEAITQNYIMRLVEFRDWVLKVQAQEPSWINIADPSIKIPATNTFFTTSDGTYQLPASSEVEIYEGDRTAYTTLPFSVRVDNLRGFPSGTYALNLSFNINGDVTNFTMYLTIPQKLDITTTVPTSYINFTEAQVFDLSSKVANTVDTQINISANTKWELFLDTSSFGNAIGNYSFEVLGGEGNNLVLPNKNKTSMIIGNSYLIAVGDKSFTDNRPPIEIPTYIRIRYYLNNNTLSYFPEGSFNNYFIYRIQEK